MSVLWILGALAAVYVLLCLGIAVFQRHLVYFPDPGLEVTPASAGLPYADVTLRTDDGERLHGWFVPAAETRPGPDPAPPGPFRAVLFSHGNAGNISHRLPTLRMFHELGLSVLIYDYRGYGRSTGRPGEAGVYRDVRAGWRFLVEDRGFAPGEIVAFGRSLGGAVAIDLASEHQPGALIVEATFSSAVDLGAKVYPWLPVRLLTRHRYESDRKVGAVACPKLFIHSRDDTVVPPAMGRALFEAADDPKRFVEVRGEHGEAVLVDHARYEREIATFLSDDAAGRAPR